MDENTAKIYRTIKRARASLLGAVDANGAPNIKALLKPRKQEGVREFWFSTNTSSRHVQQYLDNPTACLYFFHKGLVFNQGVLLIGRMEVLTDPESKQMLWQRGDQQLYYKQGVTDPDYCVLKFTASSARYWDWRDSFEIEI
jgi:general stress protein 26